MKTIFLVGLISLLVLLLMFSVSAIEQPLAEDSPVVLGSLEQPLAPGTGTQGECTPWEVKNARCEGDIRHWNLCQKTASGGKWTPHSERCTDYGSNIKCIVGRCQRTEDVTKTIMYAIIGIAIIAFVIFYMWKKR